MLFQKVILTSLIDGGYIVFLMIVSVLQLKSLCSLSTLWIIFECKSLDSGLWSVSLCKWARSEGRGNKNWLREVFIPTVKWTMGKAGMLSSKIQTANFYSSLPSPKQKQNIGKARSVMNTQTQMDKMTEERRKHRNKWKHVLPNMKMA